MINEITLVSSKYSQTISLNKDVFTKIHHEFFVTKYEIPPLSLLVFLLK